MRHRSVTHSSEAAFSALADPSRPAISKHLKILRRAHLVEERREGRHRMYQLNPEPLKAVDSWLEHYRSFWSASLTNLKSFVEAEYEKELRTTKPSRK